MRRTVTSQLVGDHSPGLTTLAFEQLAKEAPRRSTITPCLHQDVDHVAILIHRPPKVVSLAPDRDEDFVQMPGVAQTTLSSLQLRGVSWTELLTPQADGFVGDGDSSFGQEILNISETQSKPVVQPDCMTDDLRREAVSVVPQLSSIHPATLPIICST